MKSRQVKRVPAMGHRTIAENDTLREETKELQAQLGQQNETFTAWLAKLEAQSSAIPVSLH